ncbi:MAG: hypothetical protein PHU23_19590 [Dehalococcoidales bacterium]|nr:hypothetical protein [Dehalococcoidales bacterium]
MLVRQDFGELLYGGAVTGAEWWDSQRILNGTIQQKEILKKAGFWTYMVIGLGATLASIFGWMRRQESWWEHISSGFIYDLPRQTVNAVTSMKTTASGGMGEANAVKQAREILRQKHAELAAGKNTGWGGAMRTQFEVTNPQDILV